MKKLNQYIIEAINKFAPTKEWVIEHYNKFNKELFNNELPSSNKISLSIFRSKTDELGCQGFLKQFLISKDKMENGMYRMFRVRPGHYMSWRGGWRNGRQYTEPIITEENTIAVKSCLELEPFININSAFVATEYSLEDTLIHEMIHLWISKDGLEPKQAHGKEFKRKCTEIRNLAKQLYGIEYELGTKAKNNNEFEYDEKKKLEEKQIIEKNKKRGGGVLGVYIILNDEVNKTRVPYTNRFFFCTKRKLNDLINEVRYFDKKYLLHIYITENSYEKMCNIYGTFKIMNKYKFWDANKYDKAKEIMMENAKDIYTMNESKKPYMKPEMNIIEIPKETNLSNIDLENIVNEFEDDNIQSSLENEKNIISPK